MSDDLTAWLREQLDADERAARGWLPLGTLDATARNHVAGHDPARVLAEVAAKRAILDRIDALRTQIEQAAANYAAWLEGQRDPHPGVTELGDERARLSELESAVVLLARPYADRPGWREEWRA